MRHEIERFRAISDTGTEYTVLVYQDFIGAPSHDNPHAELPGMKSLFTSTNYIDAETLKVVETDEVIRKV